MSTRHVRVLAALLAGLTLAASAGTGVQPPGAKKAVPGASAGAGETAFFEKEVLPIIKANCFKCHATAKPRGGLSLASRKGLLAGGDLGPAVSLEKPDESLLLKAIHYRDGLEM